MEMDKEDDGIPNPSPSPSPNPNPNPNPVRGSKGKSCKGCLYYSSILKSKSQNPRCIGISRTLHQGASLPIYAYFSSCIYFSLCLTPEETGGRSKKNQKFNLTRHCVVLSANWHYG